MVSLIELRRAYRERFGGEPRLFRAPGRVNLMGEHTDYNQGFVLSLALDRAVVVASGPGVGRTVRVFSRTLGEEWRFELGRPRISRQKDVLFYVEGMANGLEALGVRLLGTNLVIDGDIPMGVGLSSSAALEMAVGQALAAESGQHVGRYALALLGQQVEQGSAGMRFGATGPLSSVFAAAGFALLIDGKHFGARRVPVSLPGTQVVICDSKVKPGVAASAYNDRRSECDEAVRFLRARLPGVQALAEVSEGELLRMGKSLPEVLRKRARHVVSENARTGAAAEALEKGDVDTLGQLMAESHRSLRDDFEVSCPELDALVEMALRAPGCRGARMTGGGFGGCTVNLVEEGSVGRFSEEVAARFNRRFGQTPEIFTTSASDGLREL